MFEMKKRTDNEVLTEIAKNLNALNKYLEHLERGGKWHKFGQKMKLVEAAPLAVISLAPMLLSTSLENQQQLITKAGKAFSKQNDNNEYMGWRLTYAAKYLQSILDSANHTLINSLMNIIPCLCTWVYIQDEPLYLNDTERFEDACNEVYMYAVTEQERSLIGANIEKSPDFAKARSHFKI